MDLDPVQGSAGNFGQNGFFFHIFKNQDFHQILFYLIINRFKKKNKNNCSFDVSALGRDDVLDPCEVAGAGARYL